ncbi:hypothetical protein [Methanotorris igneus]|uniref:Uncharacterized protein n=1 Tax=Methanotorris igneus (strain DSM 5666 / JCM 11834 / Kol 5) TaxID=880724 RepID=F6BB36_METIK|nr:hypothetical protein [Methanotorris igneus]AEF95921.1 hypothetical protein Metig_0365 [Methanotorris igneus Kol 5]
MTGVERWVLNYPTKCYHCQRHADQIIEIYTNQAFVKCSNCGATRYYLIRRVAIEEENILELERNKKSKYDIWDLKKEVTCYNCKKDSVQDILVTESKLIVRCRNCGFSRYYWFHMVSI